MSGQSATCSNGCAIAATDPRGATAREEQHGFVVDLGTLGACRRPRSGGSRITCARTGSILGAPRCRRPTTSSSCARTCTRRTTWHAVTEFATDVAGELGLQAFYAAQGPGGLPLLLIAMGFLNSAIYAQGDRERRFQAVADGWEMGKRAESLFGVRWVEALGPAGRRSTRAPRCQAPAPSGSAQPRDALRLRSRHAAMTGRCRVGCNRRPLLERRDFLL